MAEHTSIEWCHHTFNAVIGCQAVSPACDHCYAEAQVKRFGGDFSYRRLTIDQNWKQPLRWNRKAFESNERRRVFCCSMSDVFDNKWQPEWRARLWRLIRVTPHLDWLLLTKRPQNIPDMLPSDWRVGFEWADGYSNVWLGCTVENKTEAHRRIPHLLSVPAKVRFLSCEPLLEPLDLSPWMLAEGIDWVICGGETGKGWRHMEETWARDLRDQCANYGVPFFMKQMSNRAPIPEDLLVREFPNG
jgi:protein gp37